MTARLTMKLEMTEAQVVEACQEWGRKQVPGWAPGPAELRVSERRVGPREDFSGYDVTADVTMTMGGAK